MRTETREGGVVVRGSARASRGGVVPSEDGCRGAVDASDGSDCAAPSKGRA